MYLYGKREKEIVKVFRDDNNDKSFRLVHKRMEKRTNKKEISQLKHITSLGMVSSLPVSIREREKEKNNSAQKRKEKLNNNNKKPSQKSHTHFRGWTSASFSIS